MAIYHLRAKTGNRLHGNSAKAKADYIQREGKYRDQEDKLVYKESGNMPAWTQGASDYWRAADTFERSNGRLYKEVEFALPRELDRDVQVEVARRFVQKLAEKETLPYTLAVHEGKGENPHAHAMISERANDGVARTRETWFSRANPDVPEKGGARKTESLKDKAWLQDARASWASEVNETLARKGLSERVDHRALEAQGIDRVPTEHIGVHAAAMEAKGIRTERGDRAIEIDRMNREIVREKAIALRQEQRLERGQGQEY